MAPKGKPAGKKGKKRFVKGELMKKPLTEEEKKAKAEFEALKAKEMVKKAIRDRRAAFKQAMIEEEKRSTKSMLEIHKEWRNIMRRAKIEEQRNDIDWLSKKHVHQVELKDYVISLYVKQMNESEAQHRNAQIKHLSMLDALLDLHYLRTTKMEEEFQEQLKSLEDSFMSERNLMTTSHTKQQKELKDMLVAMKAEAEETTNERRQVFEATRDELKNKNTEEYNMLRISLENGIEDLERRIEHTHQTYLSSTEAKTISFKNLVAKDATTARVIEQRMRKLIKLHEELAYWRIRIVTNGKNFDIVNKKVRDEKETLMGHYITLKRLLDRTQHHEHDHLKEISKNVLAAKNTLMDKYVAAQRVLLVARRVSKLETEHEKVFPFDPLYCSAVPTVPGTLLEKELAEDESAKKAGVENELGVPLPIVPSQFPAEPVDAPIESDNKTKLHWASWAKNDAGNEVDEIDYMSNFYKRFNKVKLDTVAIQIERNKLSAENSKLVAALGSFIESQTIPERLKRKYNILLTVRKKPHSPRATPVPWWEPPPMKKKAAEEY